METNTKIPQEIWASYIVEKLWKENPHLNLCFDESANVLGGAVVYLPQSGAKPNVVKNRDTFPAEPKRRKDTAILYALDDYSTDPTHMPLFDNMKISYNKTDSVLGDHTSVFAESVGDEMLYNWIRGFKPDGNGGTISETLPVANIIKTTGDLIAVNEEDGQTGTRKAFTYKELQKAQAKMNKANVSKIDRYAMLESNLLQQFIDSLSANQMAAFQAAADLANGVVGRFAGFTILERSSVVAFNTSNAPIIPGQALDATDNIGALVWQKNSVAKAVGETRIFQDLNDPRYYGDIYSEA